MLIEDLDSLPSTFTDGIRGVLLLKRNKDGECGNAQRKAIKHIYRSTEEWKEAVREAFRCMLYLEIQIMALTKRIDELEKK